MTQAGSQPGCDAIDCVKRSSCPGFSFGSRPCLCQQSFPMVAHSALLHHQHFIPTPPAQLGSSLRAPTTHQRVRIRVKYAG